MKTINKTQQGFTLVELIIVIVILGILAVTAAPRFLNFQGDARTSVVQGVEGAVRAAISLVNGKAIIAGATNAEPDAAGDADTNAANTIEGVRLTYGYPKPTDGGIRAAIDFPNGWVTSEDATTNPTPALAGFIAETVVGTTTTHTTAGTIRIAADLASLQDNGCYVQYVGAGKTVAGGTATLPIITVETAGCN
ncbi:prepilin-type N-terminal cleavage/methylation domain-containing protein [Rheinheimera sp. 1928-s]|uniref:prepilin-type N-terminal cleavage/methylation domain-containing protein n=1 Tax=Rheinheimera sp. 1928-s TaxID=3033803 RepID=UPI002613A2D9|nr:prepilin-type N-terminal cleavage/methylation domain-containing protein [Rheinheimera sp. 1928-s]MDF3124921.1 prepilin-type N-terminal cleavage/methylation domain-containing protein [Rheinheimera sp. 1928-s]